ncbi:unnamed protein product [Caenorhabditis auriculariae]|uniref:Uncharacterized protein n=1 Tax=Caenorhabditis auriculariae TaxID=2777116 RepID=A0A8S1GZZ8_9PELO|nr:unnamed protein product [Caenorhabditis auriculariae]
MSVGGAVPMKLHLGVANVFLVLVALVHSFESSSLPTRSEDNWCHGDLPGDCNPETCGGSCEAKYVRYFDKLKGDRLVQSCQCHQERLCSFFAYSGCRTYATLSTLAQKSARYWSMDPADRKGRFGNDARVRYFDKIRHRQLLYGNSRFCCRTPSPKRTALHLKSSNSAFMLTPLILSFLRFIL